MIKDIIIYRGESLVATPYIQGMSELDAQNYHANEDRKARNRQANNDRIVQAVVAGISAVAAIGAAYLTARFGIERLSATSAHYTIISAKASGGTDVALKLDTQSGQTWVLAQTPRDTAWVLVRQ